MKKVILTRQELYDLVWSIPLLALSKKYNISDNGLRKICNRMNIPLPKNGYWQRVRYDWAVSIKKLPEEYSGNNAVTLYLRDKSITTDQLLLKNLINEIKNNPDLSHKVPSKLSDPDRLIVTAKENLIHKKPNKYDQYVGVVETSRGELNIRVAPVNVGRALLFFDALIKILKARKHSIVIIDNKTYAIIEEEKLEISLKEKFKIVYIKEPWKRRVYQPIGILAFKMEGSKTNEWKDGKKTLEDKLIDIVAKIELEGKRKREKTLYNLEQKRIYEENQRVLRELKERQEKEIQNFKNLLKQANRWQQAEILREYLNALEEKTIKKGSLSDELKNWFNWAKQKADWYDPLIDKKDIVIGDIDKNNVSTQ